MFRFMNNFKPRDFFALSSLVAVVIFKLTGHNGTFDAVITLIVGYYFGRRDDAQVNVIKSI